MAAKHIVSQLDIQAVSSLISTASGFIGFAAKADGLYQKIGTSADARLLTTVDNGSFIQNQNASAQAANMWISGSGYFNGDLTISRIVDDVKLNIFNKTTNGKDWYLDSYSNGKLYFGNQGGNYFNLDGTTGAATFASTIQATTAKLTNLTDGYLPYHISDVSGLGNSPIYTDGTNVGIGTTAPSNLLSIQGVTDPVASIGSDANNIGWMRWNTAGKYLDFTTRESATYYVNTLVLKGGNVGIGTTGPSTLLHVMDYGTNLGITSDMGILVGGTGSADQISQIGFGYTENTRVPAVIGAIVTDAAGATKSALIFGTRDSTVNTVAPTERMRIASNGNVGIGTTGPQGKLTVTGSSFASDSATGIFMITTGTGVNTNSKLNFGIHDGDYAWIQSVQPGSNVRNLALNPDGGNVGIGTTAPGNKLHIYQGASGATPYEATGGFVLESNTRAVIQMLTPNTVDQYLMFGDPQNANRAWLGYNHATDLMTLQTGGNITMNGNVGIGTTGPTSALQVSKGMNGGSSSIVGVNFSQILMTTDVNSLNHTGLLVAPTFNTSSSNVANGYGMKISPIVTGTYTLANGYGLYVDAPTLSSGILTNSYAAVFNGGNVGIGTTAPTAPLQVHNGLSAGYAQISGNAYGPIYTGNGNIQLHTNHAVYFIDFLKADGVATTPNMRIVNNGNVGIGLTSPTAKLHLAAGSATASTAPLKFTSGALLTAPEAGAVEFLTDGLYCTITTGAARKQISFTDHTHNYDNYGSWGLYANGASITPVYSGTWLNFKNGTNTTVAAAWNAGTSMYDITVNNTAVGMTYPSTSGIAVSNGSAWTTSLATTNLSALAGLTWTSGSSFVRMTNTGVFNLDNSVYSISTHDHAGTYQLLDADLTSIAGLTATTGVLTKTAANTWALVTDNHAAWNDAVTYSGQVYMGSTYGQLNSSDFSFGYGTYSITGKEASLGNPSVTGYVLSSTTAGVRSWVAQSGGSSYTLPLMTNGTRGGAQIGYSNYYGTIGIALSGEQLVCTLTKSTIEYALTGNITSHTHTLPATGVGSLGGIKLGFTATGSAVPLQTSSDVGFVTVSKASVEYVLTGAISTHTHAYAPINGSSSNAFATAALTATGNIVTTNSYTIEGQEVYRRSSRLLKHNIVEMTVSAMDILNATKICTYNMNADNSFSLGFIAEDTHEWLSSETHTKHVFGNHLGLLTKAIQEEDTKLEEMKLTVLDLQARVRELEIDKENGWR